MRDVEEMEDILKADNVCAFKYNLYKTQKARYIYHSQISLNLINLHLLADSKKS